MKKQKKKIFLGAQEIAGMLLRLNNAFHEMDIESDFYCLYRYDFQIDNSSKFANKRLKKHRSHVLQRTAAKSKVVKEIYLWLQLLDIIQIYIYALFHYDYFLYIFGHGMFYYHRYLQKYQEIEFKILKLFNKKMIMWFCGSDSRAPYCDVDIYDGDYQKMYFDVLKKSNNIKMIEKYMKTIDFPASSHFHTKPYIIYNCITVPIDSKECVKTENRKRNDVPVILHAPSNKAAKGTHRIREIINEIEKNGYKFKYVEVSGMPHGKVLEEIANADIVIDQLFCDTPMAGFATEAGINGIPVIVGGYYASTYKKTIPEPIAPTVFCLPEELKSEVIKLLVDENRRKEIGCKEQEYVKNMCMSSIVAERFLKIFSNEIPSEWLFNLDDNDYIWGLGSEKQKVADNVYHLIRNYGDSALGLNRNSTLFHNYMNLYMVQKEHENL